jgi:hypothetical protein
MSPNMRKKLERNIQYHAAMAEYHGDEAKKKQDAAPPDGTQQPTASASPPAPDPDAKLADTHSETVSQLQALIDAEPIIPAIVSAQQSRPVMRNMSADVRPSSGVFH